MDFLEAMPVTFKEIIPNYNVPEKWKEVTLNTGGTHSTLQDIKLPQKAGGYWYKDSTKVYTRNRFIYWQTTSDAIELSEASLDINLSSANLRCKVAPGTPPLSSITVYERSAFRDVVILAATVSSVHRLIFPHPGTLDKKSTFGPLSSSSPSIFHDTSAINNPNNYYILNQYSNATAGVAHTCSTLLRDNGEAVFALAFGHGGEGGLLIVKLPVAGSAFTTLLKRESTVPRFLSGLTGALRGKSSTDGVETYGVVLTNGLVVAICGDTCLRAWQLDEGGAPIAVSSPLSQTLVRPKPPPHGHMLQRTVESDGSVIMVAYLSFPNECEFVVMKMHNGGSGGVRFSHISRIFGPQLDLLDYVIGYGESSNVIWALWSQPDGDTIITCVSTGAEALWRAVASREAGGALPVLGSHDHYRDRLLAPALFPPAVIRKALVIYNRTWGNSDCGLDGDLGEAAMNAVQARLRHLTARTASPDHAHLMHKCWSDLYSWCMQYMESLQKPLGLMVSKHESDVESGWWCAVVRRTGISLVCELEPLERMMLSPDAQLLDGSGVESGELSEDAVRIVVAGARWERAAPPAAAAELEQRLFACGGPQHRLLPRLLHLLLTPADRSTPILTPHQIEELTSILNPIKDLQSAVLELNDALRLDVPEIETVKSEEGETDEYECLLASDLGVAVVTEAIRQMAEMRSRVVRGALCVLGAYRDAGGVPGAGHCAVHWQAYRALLWLRAATLQPQPTARCCGSVQLPCSHSEYPSTTYVPAGSAPATAPCTGRPTARCCGSVQLPCSHSEYPSTTYVPAGSAPATAPCTGRPTARCCGSVQLPCSHSEYPSTTYVPAGSAPATAPCTGRPTARCCGSVQLPCSHSEYPSTTYVPAGSAPATAPCTGRPTARCCGSVQLPCSHSEYPSTTYVPAGSAPATAPCTGRPTARCCGSVQLPCSHSEYPSTTYVPAGSAPATAPCTGRPTARCCGSVQLPCSHSEYPSTTYVPAGSAPATAPCTGRPTARCCGSVQLPCSHSEYPSTTYVPAGSAPATAPCTGRPTARCCGSVQLPCSHSEYPSTTYVPAGSAPATAPCTGRPTARCCGSVQLPCSHSEYPSTTYVPAGSAPATAPCTGRPTARCCGSVQLPCSHSEYPSTTYVPAGSAPATAPCTGRPTARCCGSVQLPCSHLAATVSTHLLRMYQRAPSRPLRRALAGLPRAAVAPCSYLAATAYRALLWLRAATLQPPCSHSEYPSTTYVPAGSEPATAPCTGRPTARCCGSVQLPCSHGEYPSTTYVPAGSAPATAPCTGRPTARCCGSVQLPCSHSEYPSTTYVPAGSAPATAPCTGRPTARCCGSVQLPCSHSEYPSTTYVPAGSAPATAPCTGRPTARCCGSVQLPCSHSEYPSTTYVPAGSAPATAPCTGRPTARCCGSVQLPCSHSEYPSTTYVPAGSAPATAPCTGRPTARCCGSVQLPCSHLAATVSTHLLRMYQRAPSRPLRRALAGLPRAAVAPCSYLAATVSTHLLRMYQRAPRRPLRRALAGLPRAAVAPCSYLAATLQPQAGGPSETFRLKLSALGAEARASVSRRSVVAEYVRVAGGARARSHLAAARAHTAWHHALPLLAYHLAHQLWAVSGGFDFSWWLASIDQPRLVQNYVTMLEPWCEWNSCSRQFILGLALLDLDDAEKAYTAFYKAAKGVSTEPFLRGLVAADSRLTQHQALVLYYVKVIKLFQIHDAGACVVRLAETAISIADTDDPNLTMFQWVVFKWHLSSGQTARALSAAAAIPARHTREAAAATLLTTLGPRRELGALVSCSALAEFAERAAAARAKLHDAHAHNPYYDFLYALYISRHHYRKAASIMYERAARCGAERSARGAAQRRRCEAAALTCLRLARPGHDFLVRPHAHSSQPKQVQVIGPEELAAELREDDPDSLDPVQRALLRGGNLDFDALYPNLKEADPETLLAITKRAISTEQFLPHWFLERYMEVEGAGAVRALLGGGRAAEAGALCGALLKRALGALVSTAPPRDAPLGLADLILAELRHHTQDPYVAQVYTDLHNLVEEYVNVVKRTSQDMKLITCNSIKRWES
ncbi:unnamed protein product [Arctia plantaginis]|uniref:Nuclear pore complex protein Nup160 n=1 Tax=Arctia plantaginis TaxID=874455 RepID=A0A8S1B530_ARCPL|nr:unnamed protein product [Arctia plantaginis]